MRLHEHIINNGGGVVDALGLDNAPRVGTMTQAFQQPNWKYGKIDNQKCLEAHGIADIEFTVHWAPYWTECCHVSSRAGFVAPTGTKIDARQAAYVFSPVIGNNHHWGLLFGNEIHFDFWSRGNHSLSCFFNARGCIVVTNYQVRSFDVKDQQWSRYMEVYNTQDAAELAQTNNDANSGTSGINVFTKCLKVDPRYYAYGATALTYQYCRFTAEIGYDIYIRHAEEVTLNRWDEKVAFKAVQGLGKHRKRVPSVKISLILILPIRSISPTLLLVFKISILILLHILRLFQISCTQT